MCIAKFAFLYCLVGIFHDSMSPIWGFFLGGGGGSPAGGGGLVDRERGWQRMGGNLLNLHYISSVFIL